MAIVQSLCTVNTAKCICQSFLAFFCKIARIDIKFISFTPANDVALSNLSTVCNARVCSVQLARETHPNAHTI